MNSAAADEATDRASARNALALTRGSFQNAYTVYSVRYVAAYLGFKDRADIMKWFFTPVFLTAFAEFVKLGFPPRDMFAEVATVAAEMFYTGAAYGGDIPTSFEHAAEIWPLDIGNQHSDGTNVECDNQCRRIAYMLNFLVSETGWVHKPNAQKTREAEEARIKFHLDSGLQMPAVVDGADIKKEPVWTHYKSDGTTNEVYAERWNRAWNVLQCYFKMTSRSVEQQEEDRHAGYI